MNTLIFQSFTPDELETMTPAELAAYEEAINTQIAALKSAAWNVDMERWTRECPQRMAERSAFNATLAKRCAGIDVVAPRTERRQLAA